MLKDNLQKGMDFLQKEIIKEMIGQGRDPNSKLIQSIETIVKEKGNLLVGQILLNDYSIYLDKGVKASKVPYNRGSGAKSSKYIQALIEWAKSVKPNASAKERKSFAFAVANKAKKEGHPTKGSYAFSKNGRRTAWSEYSIDRNINEFIKILDLEKSLVTQLENTISKFTKAA